jgi:predicted short-subunit dehydrogenase-like oxidoreductase (DUF2520 family)
MGAEPLVLDERDRPAYAEAIGAATEFSRAVVRQAADALREMGVDRPDRVLGGLVRAAVEEELGSASLE